MKQSYKGLYYSQADLGRVRNVNQDQVLATRNEYNEILLLVADGIGGLSNGENASSLIKSTFEKEFQIKKKKSAHGNRNWIIRLAKKINREIFNYGENESGESTCGSTLSVCLICDKKLVIVHVGDSRIYICKDKKLKQLTDDQTVASYLEKTGQNDTVDNNPAVRHGLTNAVGIYPSLAVDCGIFAYNGEPILLCTDGLYNELKEEEIEAIVNSNDSINEKVNMLIAEANGNGGNDNIGIVYWETL